MKNLIWIIIALALVACPKPETVKPTLPGEPTAPVVVKPIETKPSVPVNPGSMKLAWGSDHADWDKYLTDAVNASPLRPDVQHPCKKLSAKDCLIQAISIMAKYESSFKPGTSYEEGFNDSSGNNVISRGLLQISIESANQKAYGCNIKSTADLHEPKINLECAVKIAVKWINQDGKFFGDAKAGLGRYWSVGRVSSGSNAKILKYLSEL